MCNVFYYTPSYTAEYFVLCHTTVHKCCHILLENIIYQAQCIIFILTKNLIIYGGKNEYYKGYFRRATLQGLADYLIYGSAIESFFPEKDYDKKLEKAYKEYEENLKTQNIESIQPFIDLANNLTSEVAEAYTAIGLKAGFLILFDILKELEK